MKYIISLILAAIVYGQTESSALNREEMELCEIKASVFSIRTGITNRLIDPIALITEKAVKACKEKSKALVFRGLIILADKTSSSEEAQVGNGVTDVEKIDSFYGHEKLKFYDGFEFDVSNLNKTMVGRLVEERSKDQVFSLAMPLKKWSEVASAIPNDTPNLHHVKLIVDPGEKLKAIESAISLAPTLTFAVRNSTDVTTEEEIAEATAKAGVMKLAREASDISSRKVGHTIYFYNNRDADLTYTIGIEKRVPLLKQQGQPPRKVPHKRSSATRTGFPTSQRQMQKQAWMAKQGNKNY
ncbi:hypothetical protein DSO57_1031415 [Entomophthora muscae]|uniref:Uncharacterized protein n=1 Tax=Entomophthora muscae TaxID=34485 RepID=A0ACC2TN12_9FUNG|nr:hypothetical protein DSO57_1031415 [Entomophthora muscae]